MSEYYRPYFGELVWMVVTDTAEDVCGTITQYQNMYVHNFHNYKIENHIQAAEYGTLA
jgi:hypothetical protein